MPNSPIQSASASRANRYVPDEESRQHRSLNSLVLDLISVDGLEKPNCERLGVIIDAALKVKYLLFTAALEEPTAEELEGIAEDFIRRALTSRRSIQ